MEAAVTTKRSIRDGVLGILIIGGLIPLADYCFANSELFKEMLPAGFLETAVGAIGLVVWRWARDFWKHSGKEKLHEYFFPLAAIFLTIGLLFAFPGCATMRSETINDDGSSHFTTVSVPPFSKQKLADFGYEASVASDGSWKQKINSLGEDFDTTPQLEMGRVMGEVMGAAILAAVKASAPVGVQALDKAPAVLEEVPDVIDSISGLSIGGP